EDRVEHGLIDERLAGRGGGRLGGDPEEDEGEGRGGEADVGDAPGAALAVVLVEQVGQEEGEGEGEHADGVADVDRRAAEGEGAEAEELAADDVGDQQGGDEEPGEPDVDNLLPGEGVRRGGGVGASVAGGVHSRGPPAGVECTATGEGGGLQCAPMPTAALMDAPAPERAERRRTPALRQSLRYGVYDGALYSLMVGAGESYLALFVLAAGLGEVASGLVSTVPFLLGAVLRLASPWRAEERR